MRRTFMALVLLVSPACAADEVSASEDENDEQDTGDDDEPAQPCNGAENDWINARTNFPWMRALWSNGEQFIAHYDRNLLVHDGVTTTLLESATPATTLREIEARSLDEAWFVRPTSIDRWDGNTLTPEISEIIRPFVEVAADGRVWALAHKPCTVDACQPRVWEREDDGSWTEHVVPDLRGAISFAVAPGGELWIGTEDHEIAHRRDGEWTVDDLVALSSDAQFLAQALDVDADGHLWAGSGIGSELWLAHWSPTDGWTASSESLFVSDYDYFDLGSLLPWTLIADGDAVIAFRRYAEHPLRRASVSGPFEDLVTPDQLGLDPLVWISGSNDGFAVLSHGPRVRAVDPNAEPAPAPAIKALADLGSINVHIGSAATVDAPFNALHGSLYRFDGEGWVRVLEVPPSTPEGALIRDVYADTNDSGWLIAGERNDCCFGVTGRQLYRWEGEQLSLADWDPPQSTKPKWLWGAGPDRVWLVADGPAPNYMLIWQYDGVSWQLVHEDPVYAAAVSGDAEGLYIARTDGVVIAYQGGEWRDLGQAVPAPYQPKDYVARDRKDTIARVGTDIVLGNMRWDGEAWLEMPEPGPIWSLSNDIYGRAWAIVENQVFRHDGVGSADQGWVESDHPSDDEQIPPSQLTAAADGVVVYTTSSTAVFRWACE